MDASTSTRVAVGLLALLPSLSTVSIADTPDISAVENAPKPGASRSTEGPQSYRPSNLGAKSEAQGEDTFVLPSEADKALQLRVEGRWNALIQRDLKAAYAYMTPDYRRRYTLAEYAAMFGGGVDWHAARLNKLRYENDSHADVIVSLDVSLMVGSDMARTEVPMPEKWTLIEGEWYFDTDLENETVP